MTLIRGGAARWVRKHRVATVVYLAAAVVTFCYFFNREIFHNKFFELFIGPVLDRVVEVITENHGDPEA